MKNKINLSNIKIDTPFKVPERYFEKMENDLFDKISKQHQTNVALKPRYIWSKWAIGIAASLVLLVGIYFSEIYQNNKTERELAKISNLQMVQYLENENIDLADLTENIKISNTELDKLVDDNFELTPRNFDGKLLIHLDFKYLD